VESVLVASVRQDFSYSEHQFEGFLPPLKARAKQPLLRFKPGSIIPVKFKLTDLHGNYVSNAAAQRESEKATAGGQFSGFL
jgi:hypothetical protein